MKKYYYVQEKNTNLILLSRYYNLNMNEKLLYIKALSKIKCSNNSNCLFLKRLKIELLSYNSIIKFKNRSLVSKTFQDNV